ncbi:GMP synthase (glutamine-hydrolyzing) [Tumebacillus algifaecis]|uniref:GMP synthase [glutamine-hydrolyzing] n=1 Tax=Tumebacillus algifaecis TaxID=1214604 RepID=A0A223D5C1_9BACL|nr:glutamine-hydrolyzing GMP synthase [Tumebacillus algifaecis]ASS76771.1 GMP synthase (glutamine-hydrolyzing) [Tumebacillus algifaecis]
MEQKEIVVVLDFGGQYNQLITRRIRELNVYSELMPYQTTAEELKQLNLKGIVFSGGPNSVYADGAPKVDPAIFELGVPILGICYGMQLLAHHFDAKVERADVREYGKSVIEVQSDNVMFAAQPASQQVWMSHSDKVVSVPSGFRVDATTATCPVAAMSDAARKLYAVQYHLEVNHSEFGQEQLKHFLYEVCAASGSWTSASFVDEAIAKIKAEVGDKKVLCALSGGVDSSVAAVLVHRAIGDNLTCMFVDHGLLRKNEAEQVMEMFAGEFKMNVVKIDARDRFLGRLAGVSDPERKRKIIGEEFIRVFEEESKALGQFDFLAQGTLYTDIIESGTATAATIKSHHNVGGLPEDMQFELVEPLNALFKDEVRAAGTELGIKDEIVWRQPFPGPGLAIRIIGDVTADKLEILQDADFVVRDEIRRSGLDREIWQYFAVLPDVRSVGVMGDERTYAYTIAIRGVTSSDGMTADWARIPYDVLERLSVRLVNEVRDVNRVVYDITSKPPATIEWE